MKQVITRTLAASFLLLASTLLVFFLVPDETRNELPESSRESKAAPPIQATTVQTTETEQKNEAKRKWGDLVSEENRSAHLASKPRRAERRAIRVSRTRATDKSNATELDWDDLIPEGMSKRDIFEKYGGGAIYENRALYDRFMKEYEKVKENPPVVEMLDGKVVRLPGYVVPLDMEADAVQEFLLVPDYGYCVHVPPPPANQLVHVFTRKDRPFKGQLFDVVWVTGKMRVVKSENEFGEAGYRIDANSVKLYE